MAKAISLVPAVTLVLFINVFVRRWKWVTNFALHFLLVPSKMCLQGPLARTVSCYPLCSALLLLPPFCPTDLCLFLSVICPSCFMTEDGHTLSHSHTILRKLVTQDPRCYYRMVDAVIRRHACEAAVDAVSDDILCLRHPADAEAIAVSSNEQQETPCTGSMDTCSTKDQGGSADRQCIDQFYLSVALGIVAVAVCRNGGSSYECADQLYMALAMGLMTIAVCTSSSATNSSNGSSTSSSRRHKVLADWRQTHAFLSALLSYRKAIMLLLRGPRPLSMFHALWKDVSILVLWFKQEGVLEQFLASPGAASSSGISSKCRGSDATAAGIAAAVGKASVGTVPSGYGSEKGPNQPTADPDEVAACRMLTLGVLARVLLTYCQLLPFPGCSTGQGEHHQNICHGNSSGSSRKGEGGRSSNDCYSNGTCSGSSADHRDGHGNCSSSSSHCNSSSGSSRVSGKGSSSSTTTVTTTSSSSQVSSTLSNLLASKLSAADLPWLVQLALLGAVCYCLLKQLVQDGIGSSSSTPNIRSSNSSSRSGMPSAAAAAAAHQKWGGLQLEVPALLVQQLQQFEVEVMGPWRVARVLTLFKRLSGGGCLDIEVIASEVQRQLQLGQQEEEQEEQPPPDQSDVRQMVELLGELLVLCEEVVHTVQIPLGCNNPNCTNLEGMSEAAAAKVCTGCHKVHYCSHECIKAHWKEHKPFCR